MSLRLHGDTLASPGTLDFAVNVWPGDRPAWLREALRDALETDRYPDEREARAAVALRHGRDPGEVLLTNGACEAFWLLAQALRPRRATCVHPGFTEPEAALRAAGAEIERVFRAPGDWRFDPRDVGAESELVVVGNPDNPTGALEPAEALRSLCRPGRLVVVDESFIDFVPGESPSLAAASSLTGLAVVRSLTKLWSLAGIRAGYLLASPDLVRLLESHRQPWSVNAPACAALAACSRDPATPARVAAEVGRAREELAGSLAALPLVERVWPSAANFLLLEVADGPGVVAHLLARGISVRPAQSFPGLGPNHIRVAVRTGLDNKRLVAALAEAPF
jgi:histidinol-phosphate aminotransferase